MDGERRWTGRDCGGRVTILLRRCQTSRSLHVTLGHGHGHGHVTVTVTEHKRKITAFFFEKTRLMKIVENIFFWGLSYIFLRED